MLSADKGSYEYYFRDGNGRLADQVKRLASFAGPTASPVGAEDDYRLGPGVGFVKFVEPTLPAFNSGVEALPNGRYHPVEGVARMLAKPNKGIRKGKVYLVDEWRSLDGATFANLVRDEWVGSQGDVTEKLLAILGLERSRQQLVLAVEHRRHDLVAAGSR